MYSKILDQKTFLAVLNAAPDVPGEYDRLAREILIKLDKNMAHGDDRRIQSMKISEICKGFPEEVTPNLVGRILGELGLSKSRRRDGYFVFYTDRQLAILFKEFVQKARS